MSSFFSKGGEKSKTPVRTPDNLRSEDTVEFLLGLGEGEIEGLEDGLKSFYVGDTRLQNLNGTDNFSNYNLKIFPGSGVDEEVKYTLTGSTRSISTNVALAKDEPVVRQGQSGEIDFLELRLLVQALYIQNDDGIFGATVNFKIEYKTVSALNWNVVYESYPITGKTTVSYVRELRWAVDRATEPYEIRITQLNGGDSTETNISVAWESFQEIDATKREFAHTALAHMTIKSTDQFSSIPEMSGVYKLMKIKIPSNYDPKTRLYSGVWDGTFHKAWTDNPAWILYDFVMNDRYGMRAYSDVELDKWDTYEAAQWCDVFVNNGKGGLEPRYTCNIVISDARNGKEQAIYMAGLFNASLVEEATGYLRLKVDKDEQAIAIIAPENVVENSFAYTFTEPETRYNDITVAFINPDLEWQEDRRRIFNQESINRNGIIPFDFIAVGCLSVGEALRRAYYKLITSLTEKTIVSFSTNRFAQQFSNFDVILVADPNMGYSLTGRVLDISLDKKTINLRDSLYLEAGINYNISFNTPSGIVEIPIEPFTGSGSIKQLILKEEVPENLPERATFSVFGSNRTGTPKPFRIISIAEVEGNPDQFNISAIELNRNKWDAVDNLTFSAGEEYSGLPNIMDIPYAEDVSFTEVYDSKNVQMNLIIGVSLNYNLYPYYTGEFLVYSRLVGAETWMLRDLISKDTIVNHPSGIHEFIILPISILGNTPPFDNAPRYIYDVVNLSEPPHDVLGFNGTKYIEGIQLRWDPNTDVDLKAYEIREVLDNQNNWNTAQVVVTGITSNIFYIALGDKIPHTYMIKAIDGMGNYSVNAAQVTLSVIAPPDVIKFYVTVNLDTVRFDWQQVEGIDITYVIRQGTSWETGIEICKTKGNNISILQPSAIDTAYHIKALSSAEVYSINARSARPDTALAQNRNILIEVDNAAEGWNGITYGFDKDPIVPKTLVMKDDAVFAEHYFPVALDKVFRARNWLETQGFLMGERLTWEDLHYRYSDLESHITWLNSQSLEVSKAGVLQSLIAMKSREPYSETLGFTLNNTLEEINNKAEVISSQNINYNSGRLLNGLSLEENTHVQWGEFEIPLIFSFSFRVRVTDDTSNNFALPRFRNTNTGDFLNLYILEGNLVLEDSDRNKIELPIGWIKGLDFLTIAVSQTEDTLSLYYSSDYSRQKQEKHIPWIPNNTYNEILI